MVEEIRQDRPQAKLVDRRVAPASRGATKRAADEVFVAHIAEKRYLWTARAFAVVTALSLCCNIVLILAIFQVLPLYRVFKIVRSRFIISSR